MNTFRQQAARLVRVAAAAATTFAIFSAVVLNAAPEQSELMARARQADQAERAALLARQQQRAEPPVILAQGFNAR